MLFVSAENSASGYEYGPQVEREINSLEGHNLEEGTNDEDEEEEIGGKDDRKYEQTHRYKSPRSRYQATRLQRDRQVYLPQSAYDSVVHSVRKLERKNNQLDSSPESGINERFTSNYKLSSGVTGGTGNVGEEGTSKTRQRNSLKRLRDTSPDDAAADSLDNGSPASYSRYQSPGSHATRGNDDAYVQDPSKDSYPTGHRSNSNERNVKSQLTRTIHLPPKRDLDERHPMASDHGNDEDDDPVASRHKSKFG